MARLWQDAAMAGRDLPIRGEPGFSLPALGRLAPPPPPELVGAWIDAHSKPGDVVLDLHARGGWIARAAVDRQRRAASLETSPLTRLLAEVVLRPPDVRHLDAAFQAIAAAPREQSALKVWLGEKFGSRCATCGRTVVLDEVVWESVPDGPPRPVHKHYRCTACRDQVGGGDQRHGAIDETDLARIAATDPRGDAWREIHERFPTLDGDDSLVEQLLDLHTPRQLAGLQAILERIETDLRSAPVEAAMRLALLHALAPGVSAERLPGPDREPEDQRREDPPAGRRPVARAQPVARLRGRLPGGPRVHPAPRGGPPRADDRPLRRGPPEPGRGDGQRGRPARDAVVVPLAGRRGRCAGPSARPAAGPARPRPAADAPERRASLDRLLRDRLDPRPGGRLAPPARRRLRRRRTGALGLAVDGDPARLRCRRTAPGPRR